MIHQESIDMIRLFNDNNHQIWQKKDGEKKRPNNDNSYESLSLIYVSTTSKATKNQSFFLLFLDFLKPKCALSLP